MRKAVLELMVITTEDGYIELIQPSIVEGRDMELSIRITLEQASQVIGWLQEAQTELTGEYGATGSKPQAPEAPKPH